MVVINCIQDTVTLVEFYNKYEGKKTISCMRPAKDTKDWVNKHLVQAMRFCAPVLEPMIVKPKPWVAGELKGGYLTDHIPRRPLAKVRNKQYLEDLKYADMPKLLKAVNAAQDTAWKINSDVLDLITELARTDSELGGVPRASYYDIPEKPDDIESNEESRKAYRAKARKAHEANVNLTSTRLSFLQILETAKKYVKYDAFYCPVQLDFRTRFYYQCQLNGQGADFVKGLMCFSEAVALGEHGLWWLKVHIANLFGVDKVTFEERVQFVDENQAMLYAIAKDPYSNQQWASADKPFQTYAACRDYFNAIESGDPSSYISNLHVALDGSCSGIQNLSLAFRDPIGAEAVNISPTERPSDIYQLVCDKTVMELKHLVEQDLPSDSEDRPSDALLAQWWLDYGMTRKVTKRNCMTFPYGSKQRGFSDQILEDTLRPFIKNLKPHEIDLNPLASFDDRGKPSTTYNPMLLSSLLARLNYQSVQQTVLKAAEAMDWMQSSARVVAKEGRPVCWTTPLGFPVVQNYLQTKEARIETSLAGERKVLSIREETLKPDTRKAANSISPNVVHSLDASHLALTVANSADQGITAFALVHDSFGTHAGNTEKLAYTIRTSMLELYADNVFEKLRNDFLAQVNPKKHSEIPQLPLMGNMNPEVVLESEYCFA